MTKVSGQRCLGRASPFDPCAFSVRFNLLVANSITTLKLGDDFEPHTIFSTMSLKAAIY
jgi:hypothetical protein